MKKDGFISVLGLLIIGTILICCMNLIYFSSLQTPMTSNTLENIQSRYLVEEKLYRLIYERDLFDSYLRYDILTGCRGILPKDGRWMLRINNEARLNENFISGYYSQPDRENLDRIKLQINCQIGKMKRTMEAELSVINYFLNIEDGIIKVNDLLEEELPIFYKMMEDLHERSFEYDAKPTDSYFIHKIIQDASLKNEGKDKTLTTNEGPYTNNIRKYYDQVLILYLISPDGEKVNLTIEGINNDSSLETKAVLYLEGDLIVNQNLKLDGIIIINGGRVIINNNASVQVNGMIIYNGEEELDESNIQINYNKRNILRFGSHLPIFLDPRISFIKHK